MEDETQLNITEKELGERSDPDKTAVECICPKCEARIAHRRGTPCQDERCPECGAKMLRVGSDDYQLWAAKKASQT